MFWKKPNACTLSAVVTGSYLIPSPVFYFILTISHLSTSNTTEQRTTVTSLVSARLPKVMHFFDCHFGWLQHLLTVVVTGPCPATISQLHTAASVEQIKWTQWFFNQITHAPNRLTFLTQVLFPVSSSPLLLSPQPEREWRVHKL